MTVFKTATVNCDWLVCGLPESANIPGALDSGCPGWFETGTQSVTTLRVQAGRSGWSRTESGLDLCPAHTRIKVVQERTDRGIDEAR